MRRKDRQMDRDFGLYVMDKSEYGTMMIVSKKESYQIPLSFARDENTIYFHSAKAGKKVELLKEANSVNIVFVADVSVPELYTKEELDKNLLEGDSPYKYISKVFTTEFASAIVEGTPRLCIDDEEKIHGLKLICEKYTPNMMDYFSTAISTSLNMVNVYAIDINNISSKRKKYSSTGEELKYMAKE